MKNIILKSNGTEILRMRKISKGQVLFVEYKNYGYPTKSESFYFGEFLSKDLILAGKCLRGEEAIDEFADFISRECDQQGHYGKALKYCMDNINIKVK